MESNRYHSLDSLRGIMMMLGIVLHSLLPYLDFAVRPPFFYEDPQTSRAAALIFVFIHMFRMPVFFALTGFFGALLYYRRGPEAYYRNRIERILYPFLVFFVLLSGFRWLSILLSTHYLEFGTFGIDPATVANYDVSTHFNGFMHLWFLYFLLIYVAVSYLMHKSLGIDSRLNTALKKVGDYIYASRLRTLWLVVPLAVLALLQGDANGIANAHMTFFYSPVTILYFGVYFAAGWYMYDHHQRLIADYREGAWLLMFLALVAFVLLVVCMGIKSNTDDGVLKGLLTLLIAVVANLSSVLFVMAFIGVFERLFAKASKVGRYLTDASYWVYLLHLHLVTIFAVMLVGWDSSALTKSVTVMLAVSAVCLISYQLFVRRSFIGVFLNGAK